LKQLETEKLNEIEIVEHLGVVQKNYYKIFAGPAVFLLLLILPVIFSDFYLSWQESGALGMLIWMTWWWIDGSVHVAITALVPIFVTAIFPVAPAAEVVRVYSNPIVFLIAGSCLIGATWKRWKLGKRISLRLLMLMGNKVRSQIWTWFILSALISGFIADTITAAVFVPVAASLLAFSGYSTNTKVWESEEATAILLAVAWGASIGSLFTPIGGGQNLIIYEFLGELTGSSVSYFHWFINLAPFSLVLIPAVGIYLNYFVIQKNPSLKGTNKFYREELNKMGPLSRGELISGLIFVIPVAAAFLHPLYENIIPWFEPPFLFFAAGFSLFFIPAEKNENVLSFRALKYFPINVLVVWPSALALAEVLEISGLAGSIMDLLAVFAGPLTLGVLLIFLGFVTFVTNISTNTASAALVIPIIIGMYVEQGLNPIPLVLALVAAVNLAFAIPSGNGCLAMASGYGINLKTMFKHGVILSLITWVISSGLAFLLNNFTGWWGVL